MRERTRRGLHRRRDMRTLVAITALQLGSPTAAASQAGELDEAGALLGTPALHHAHLNSVDPDAAIDWYVSLWPEGRRGEMAGHQAFLADMALLFNEVDAPPPGGWNETLQRAEPQSPFWHIGAFTNTTEKFVELESRGFQVLPLFTGPADTKGVRRSGRTPYSGIQTLEQLETAEPAPPRDGGFGYLVGPDGALVELTGSPRTTDSFSHVHLFHEEPRCAANWYASVLRMTLPPQRDPDTGESSPRERWEPCVAERGPAGWPSLENAGTIRSPSGSFRHETGSISFYPRQCIQGRCGRDRPLVGSRGQVLDHVGFSVVEFDVWIAHLEARGVTVLEGPYAFGPGRAILIEGPDGLVIELVER